MVWHAAHLVAPASATGEDRVAVVAIDGSLVLVVADGAGGSGGGARAADTALETVERRAPDLVAGTLTAVQLLAELDQLLARTRGETTAVVAVVAASGIVGASVGDSEAWLITDEATVELTRDQQRKPLLGTGAAVPAPFAARETTGTLLLASDGLFKYARRDLIASTLRDTTMTDTPARLVDLARLPGGGLQDDVAVIVARGRRPHRM
jgi:serine/threonine protein phosphatase PrpC